MFSIIINKYIKRRAVLFRKKKEDGDKGEADSKRGKKKGGDEMRKAGEGDGVGSLVACANQDQVEDEDEGQEGCCSVPKYCLGLTAATTAAASDHHHQHHLCQQEHGHEEASNDLKRHSKSTATTTTTTRIGRSNFAKATTTSLFPNTQFTNHESLPCLLDALSSFIQTYPQYKDTQQADRIRRLHYSRLSNHVCLDYTGFGLFSHSQLKSESQLLEQQQASSSSSASAQQPPFFGISHRSGTLLSQVHQYGNGGSSGGNQDDRISNTATARFESAIMDRIMRFVNVSRDDYTIVCTANRTSALKILAETYPFHSSKRRLLTVYDYESEAVSAMQECAAKRGAKLMSATFTWPNLRIDSAKLKRILLDKKQQQQYDTTIQKKEKEQKKKKKKKRGLFVFPLQSRMTGTRYPYLWMRLAQENGWHVVLDACALGPKDLDTLGLSLIQPDFIICSFYKVVGDNPSGFATLLIKTSATGPASGILEASILGNNSIGIVSIVPPTTITTTTTTRLLSKLTDHDDVDFSATFSDIDAATLFSASPVLSSGPPICTDTANRGCAPRNNDKATSVHLGSEETQQRMERFEQVEVSSSMPNKEKEDGTDNNKGKTMISLASEIVESEGKRASAAFQADSKRETGEIIVECLGLDHADSLGLLIISSRLRYITNWLVIALAKLRHPNAEENGHPLVRMYGPRVKFERGPSIAFNVFDWKGEKVEPALVQKLADRFNISLTCGFLKNICFSDKYPEEGDAVLEKRMCKLTTTSAAASTLGSIGYYKRKFEDDRIDVGIAIVNATLGFLANFEDAYKLWSFIARFLDADFVEKERWRYMALNQKMTEM